MKQLLYFFKNLSVRTKFVSAYISILMIAVILAGIYMYKEMSETSIVQARLVMEQNLMQTKASIIEKQKVIENVSNILAYNKEFTDFLDTDYDTESLKLQDYQFTFSPLMKNILIQNNSIYSIRVYTNEIIFTEKLNSYYSASKKNSTELYNSMVESMPGKNGWISSHNAVVYTPSVYSRNIKVFSYNRIMHTTNYQKQVGLLEIEIREDVLFDMLRDPVVSKLGKVFIVDEKNQIVSNNLSELYKKNISASGYMDYQGKTRQSRITRVNGEDAIVISIPVEEIGCSVVGIFPVKNFNSNYTNSLKQIVSVLLISALVLGIVIYFITSALLSRIRKLVKAMKRVREGNLDVSVPVDTTDEFGELALNFNHMTGRMHDLVETVYKIQLLEREAELKALEAQINPHFLYNTLATISWIARKGDPGQIVKISNALTKFYRLVLSKGVRLISVKEELDMVSSYLFIQKVRFENAFDVVYKIKDSMYDYKIVKNILQPIVENAINHGIEPKLQHGTIIISVDEDEDNIIFQIIDDGVGMDNSALQDILEGRIERSKGSGYAIKNIMERLKAYYGKACVFEIFSRPGIGTSISIAISKSFDIQSR